MLKLTTSMAGTAALGAISSDSQALHPLRAPPASCHLLLSSSSSSAPVRTRMGCGGWLVSASVASSLRSLKTSVLVKDVSEVACAIPLMASAHPHLHRQGDPCGEEGRSLACSASVAIVP